MTDLSLPTLPGGLPDKRQVAASFSRAASSYDSVAELQRDLGLVYQPENWDEVRIATWLCRNLPEQSLTHASKQALAVQLIDDIAHRLK